MPIEVRKIIFSKVEVEKSIVTFCRASGITVPDSHLQHIQVLSESPFRIAVKFGTQDSQHVHTIQLEHDQLCSALVLACKGFTTPLPRRGKKIVTKQGHGLALSISM